MNEQWINDTCMMFQNIFKDINMTREKRTWGGNQRHSRKENRQ